MISGLFFKAVVQVVLIFGLETWIPNHRMERDLGSFQQMVARQITGSQTRMSRDGGMSVSSAGSSDGGGVF